MWAITVIFTIVLPRRHIAYLVDEDAKSRVIKGDVTWPAKDYTASAQVCWRHEQHPLYAITCPSDWAQAKQNKTRTKTTPPPKKKQYIASGAKVTCSGPPWLLFASSEPTRHRSRTYGWKKTLQGQDWAQNLEQTRLSPSVCFAKLRATCVG